uniref:HORMA domain-containing protein n=1 Tax=Globodera rostochiensis TaxID=31243 RepID=A0A914HD82_GLORO
MPPFYPELKRASLRQLAPSSWEGCFPKDQLTEANRLRFLSRMAYIAVAHYLLYRGLIPKGVFKRRKIEDVAIYCFDSNKRWGHKLSEMMKGIKEAIEKKYVKQSFIMINEDSDNPNVATEVFSISFCYMEEHALSVLDDRGNSIISFGYKGEKSFRMQVKHIIKKLSAVTKHLKPLEGVTPYLKLTYYENTPDDYEPTAFKPCEGTYTFKTPPTFYNFGHTSSNETAMSFVLESVYFTEAEVADLDDLLLEQAGYKDNDVINPMDVTADGNFTSEEQQSPKIAESKQKTQSFVESDRSSGGLQVTIVTTSPVEATHSSETIEKARQDKDEMVLSVPQYGSPENGTLDADESDDIDELMQVSKKVRESPYVKTRQRARMLTPRGVEFTRRASKRVTKSSASNRFVLMSPNDDSQYNINSPIV